MIRPALAAARRGDRGTAPVEVGCNSGLMLLSDRYGYRCRQPVARGQLVLSGCRGDFELAEPAARAGVRRCGLRLLGGVRGGRRFREIVVGLRRGGLRLAVDGWE